MSQRIALLLCATVALSSACSCDDDPITTDDGGTDSAIDGSTDAADEGGADAAGDGAVTAETCDVCAVQATCTLSPPVASCVCTTGYVGDGRVAGTGCADVDECGTGGVNDCLAAAQNGTCTNSVGSFTCGCAPGYSGDGTLTGTGCTDFDECMAAMGDACVAMANGGVCVNTQGTYGCGCEDGYAGDGTLAGTGCTDVDECGTGGVNDCVAAAANGTCTNSVGGYACGCDPGYAGDGTLTGTGCTDIDECMGANDCVLAAAGGVCTNGPGDYDCDCASGYAGDGTLTGTGCADIDECMAGTDDCYADTCTNTTGAFTCTALFGTSPFQNLLVRLDVNTGAALSTTTFAATIGTITGVNGLATHPITGLIYGIAKVSATTGRVLFTMDPETFALTSIGNLGDNFSAIAFAADGTLYGVTGDGATVPETLYTIDIATAAKTLVRALGNGADGEVIAFHANGLLYHWSGNGTLVMESLDPADGFVTITNIPTIGAPGGETFGAVYNPFTGSFLISNISSAIQHLTVAGAYTNIGTNAIDDMRGLVFSTQSPRHHISPESGAEAGGNTITLRGVGIGTATLVEFGAANPASNVVVLGPDAITVTAPPGTGTVAVSATQGTVMRAFYGYTYVP